MVEILSSNEPDVAFYADGTEAPNKLEVLKTILGNIVPANLPSFTAELVRHVLPNIVANELCGVVALTTNNGSIFPIRLIQQGPRLFNITTSKEEVYTKNTRSDIQLALKTELGETVDDQILIQKLCKMLIAEYDQYLMKIIKKSCQPTIGVPDVFYRHNKNSSKSLDLFIIRAGNIIASRTRRGTGNRVIVSLKALDILKLTNSFVFNPVTNKEIKSNVAYVGKLNHSMNVYLNPYALDTDPIYIMYQGSKFDNGLFFCPYLPIIPHYVIDPVTFGPILVFTFANAYYALEKKEFQNSYSDYIRAIYII
jgi:hypothetical protein